MKRLHTIACVGMLVVALLGCSDSESSSPAPAADPQPAADLSGPYASDVAEYEIAMGKDHGLTPEEIHRRMQGFIANPAFINRFLGILTLQNPTDVWIILEILFVVKPDLMIEAGTFHGGSAALWAVILEHINPDARVITIDIKDDREKRAIALPISQRRVDFMLGSSTDPDIVAEIGRRAKGKRVLVLLDSLHSKEHVAAELEAYAPMVSLGSYLIVQDTLEGPAEAIHEFLARNESFVIDRARERYPDTNSGSGYLRRVKP
jgi:cephalosporin hydroxylase